MRLLKYVIAKDETIIFNYKDNHRTIEDFFVNYTFEQALKSFRASHGLVGKRIKIIKGAKYEALRL